LPEFRFVINSDVRTMDKQAGFDVQVLSASQPFSVAVKRETGIEPA
jgi:hypothetical protein